jgi:hypothetical protein
MGGGMTVLTTEMVQAAAERALAQGEDFTRRTAHYVAQYLVVYDEQCKGADYTSAVSAVQLWQRGLK